MKQIKNIFGLRNGVKHGDTINFNLNNKEYIIEFNCDDCKTCYKWIKGDRSILAENLDIKWENFLYGIPDVDFPVDFPRKIYKEVYKKKWNKFIDIIGDVLGGLMMLLFLTSPVTIVSLFIFSAVNTECVSVSDGYFISTEYRDDFYKGSTLDELRELSPNGYIYPGEEVYCEVPFFYDETRIIEKNEY